MDAAGRHRRGDVTDPARHDGDSAVTAPGGCGRQAPGDPGPSEQRAGPPGVGLGDPPDLDFSDFGDEPSYATRAAITDESLEVLAGLLAGRASHHGEHLSVHATMRPGPVQPRIPVWIAGRAPHRRPLDRARRWGGYVPIADPFLTPDDLRAHVGEHPHDDWDLVVQWPDDTSPADYEAAGATWLIRSTWPQHEGWREELERIASAPPG